MSALPTIEIKGERYVLVPQATYEQLLHSAEDPSPEFQKADSSGYRPALAFIDVSIARDIIHERRAAGMSQQALARAAGIRQETLSRIESGKHSPTVRTLQKIETALRSRRPLRKSRRTILPKTGCEA